MKIKYALMAVATLVAGAALVFSLRLSLTHKGTKEAVKEFVLIAKDMKFHIEGEAKLPLTVRKGERVRLTIKNEESQPIAHNFVIVGLGIRTGYVQPGELETVEFIAGHMGTWLYACLLHPGLMEGQIHILP